MKEYENVEKYVSELLQYDKVVEATQELINVINQDDETNQPIKKIVSEMDKDGEWCVYAILQDNKYFKYAMYIYENGDIVADGW
jgi:hypothetical protein